jgi:hypothetical protein
VWPPRTVKSSKQMDDDMGQVRAEGGEEAEACVNCGNTLCLRAEVQDGAAAVADLQSAVSAYQTALRIEEDSEVFVMPSLSFSSSPSFSYLEA